MQLTTKKYEMDWLHNERREQEIIYKLETNIQELFVSNMLYFSTILANNIGCNVELEIQIQFQRDNENNRLLIPKSIWSE